MTVDEILNHNINFNNQLSACTILINTLQNCESLSLFVMQQIKQQVIKNYTNTNCFHENITKDFNWCDFINYICIKDLFNSMSYIELNFSTKPNVKEQKHLLELYNKLHEFSCQAIILLVINKLTKQDLQTSWIKKLSDIPKSEISTVSINMSSLSPIITFLLKSVNLTINNDAMQLLLSYYYDNPQALLQAIKQITLLGTSDILDVKFINNFMQKQELFNIYHLSQAYLIGDFTQAIYILNKILSLSNDYVLIHWIIYEDIKKLLKIKNQLKINQHNKIKQSLSMTIKSVTNAWVESNIQAFILANKRLSYNKLITMLNLMSTLDLTIKGIAQEIPIKIQTINIIKCLTLNI